MNIRHIKINLVYLLKFLLILVISIFLLSFFLFQNSSQKNILFDLASGHIKIEDILINEEYIYEITTSENKKVKNDELIEKWKYDNNKKQLIIETINKDYYSKLIISENLQLLYKENIIYDKLINEKYILENSFYLFQKYKNGKLEEEKKYKIPDEKTILVDILNIILRIFTANQNYENKDKIEFQVGFLQSQYKFDIQINIKKVNSIDQIRLNIDNIKIQDIEIKDSILYEIEMKKKINFFTFKSYYLFSLTKPYNQLLVFFGNKKNYYFGLLKQFKFEQ